MKNHVWGVVFSQHHATLTLLPLYRGAFTSGTSGSAAGRHEDPFTSDHTGRREGTPPLRASSETLQPLKLLQEKACKGSGRRGEEEMASPWRRREFKDEHLQLRVLDGPKMNQGMFLGTESSSASTLLVPGDAVVKTSRHLFVDVRRRRRRRHQRPSQSRHTWTFSLDSVDKNVLSV